MVQTARFLRSIQVVDQPTLCRCQTMKIILMRYGNKTKAQAKDPERQDPGIQGTDDQKADP